jgi:hypothetical protein
LKRVFNAIAAAGLALTTVLGTLAPAHAVTVQEFNSSYSQVSKVKGLMTSISTEIYRNLYLGRTAQAACITENFVPDPNTTNEFNLIVRALLDSKNPANESVESYIAGTMTHICGTSPATGVAASAASPSPDLTPLKDFFVIAPALEDEIKISLMALNTQALRAANDGHREYSQCIMDKMITPTPTGMPTAGFLELFRQISRNRTSDTPVEQFYIGAIVHYCGTEPSTPSPVQQAEAQSTTAIPAPVPN